MSQAPKSLNPELSARDRFGAELRWWRQHAGLSQAALARVVHVHPDLIAKVEKAVRRASRELAANCDTVLGAGGSLLGLWVPAAVEGRTVRTAAGPRSGPRSGHASALPGPVPVGSVVERRNGGATTVIRLDTRLYRAGDLAGLEAYSHVEVVCYLRPDPGLTAERSAPEAVRAFAPRRIGLFARPESVRANRIAVSRCRLLAAGDVDLHVLDLDVPPGTPVLDLAPSAAA